MRACLESARADLEMATEQARAMLGEIALPDAPEETVYALLRDRVWGW